MTRRLPAQLPALPALDLPALTRARSDHELVASWLAGMSSELTRTKFGATAERLLSHLAVRGLTLRSATVEDVREAIAVLSQGKAPSSAVQYAQRVKSLLSSTPIDWATRPSMPA
jgi:hypothetical protein